MTTKVLFLSILTAFALGANAQNNGGNTHSHKHSHHNHSHHGHDHGAPGDTCSLGIEDQHIREVTVSGSGKTRRMPGAMNGVRIGHHEMFRAACCNLGESFVTNPAVDVSYSDAATGAKQIKLLGLSGTYVQMLTENLPNFRGVVMPYALGYVPGPWMKAISVSKGSSSVKNGYESITGQINIDYLKPDDPEQVNINVFGNSKTRVDINADANFYINDRLSTVVLGHVENTFEEHDSNNDGFYDQPKVKQFNVQNRWLYSSEHYLLHAGIGAMQEKREGGQKTLDHISADNTAGKLYNVGMDTERYDAHMKHVFLLNHDHNTNLAIMGQATMDKVNANFGMKHYYVNQKNVYASAVVESDLHGGHNISTGVSLNYDYLSQNLGLSTLTKSGSSSDINLPAIGNERETTPGAYLQWTYQKGTLFTAMAGLRVDHSSLHGTFWTPRAHVKFQPWEVFSLRLSAGKGYRTVHALAENNNLLASGRQLVIDNLEQEAAWNYGVSTSFNIPIAGETLKINADYYYTNFDHQAVTDYDTNPGVIHIANLNGKSYSHTLQIDATYPFFKGFTLTAAYRLNDVKCTYNGVEMKRPLTSDYKGLITANYETPNKAWKFDVTLQLNGGGRMPTPYTKPDGSKSWDDTFGAYEQLQAQITREFKWGSIYIGGENLTDFTQKNPIIDAGNPWSSTFDPTLVWGPVHGATAYIGTRIKILR